jgi:hypothetical protein
MRTTATRIAWSILGAILSAVVGLVARKVLQTWGILDPFSEWIGGWLKMHVSQIQTEWTIAGIITLIAYAGFLWVVWRHHRIPQIEGGTNLAEVEGAAQLAVPKLALDFDGAEGHGFVIEQQDWWDKKHQKQNEMLTVLVRVTNEGKTSAINCKIVLTDIKKIVHGIPSQTRFEMQRQLSWRGWKFDPRPLYEGARLQAELASVDKNFPTWFFHFEGITQYERPMQQDLQATYRFYVMAVADNADPDRMEIDVAYSGNWKTLSARRISQS